MIANIDAVNIKTENYHIKLILLLIIIYSRSIQRYNTGKCIHISNFRYYQTSQKKVYVL